MALIVAAAIAGTAPLLPSSPQLGTIEGQCRPSEPGPAILVTAAGLIDRRGLLRVEVYPDNDDDFLADDNVLLGQGKTFRRTERSVPPAGTVILCIRVPKPGPYALALLHDRDGNHRFGLSIDGIGFPGDPKLGWSKPHAAQARIVAGPGLTRLTITLNYRHGLLSFGPVGQRR